MKKITALIIFTLSAFGFIARAEVIDSQKAMTIANRWLGGGAELSWEGPRTKADDAPLFYVFNHPQGGWVMVSAEDAMIPVLAYAETGTFRTEDMPANLAAWLEVYGKSIRELRKCKVKADAEVLQMWQTAGYRTKAKGGRLLETAEWDQDNPYNLLCPEVTENRKKVRALTGCVATAMSIVCRYHQWPEHGTGTVGGYSYTSDYNIKVSIPSYSIDDHNYDYSLMPLKYKGSETAAQKNAVAQLMQDNGVAVEAMYNYESGTGAYSENLSEALFKHMGYCGTSQLEYRCSYSDAEWITMLKAEIDADRPILYGGVDPQQGGHQFICDGYDSKDYIHINWGWSGADNGYFALKLEIPGNCTFSDSQDMLVGLEPDRTSVTTAHGGPLAFICQTGYNSYKGLSVTSGSIASKSFSLKVGFLYNQDSYNIYSGKIRAALIDRTGALKEVISEEKKVSVAADQVTQFEKIACSIKTEPEYGDAVILQYTDGEGKWKKVRQRTDWGAVYDSVPFIDAPYIRLAESYSAGDRLYFDISETAKCVKSIAWAFDGTTQKGVCTDLSAGAHTLTATVVYTDGTKDVITATFTVM